MGRSPVSGMSPAAPNHVAALAERLRLEVAGTLDARRDVAADRDLSVYWVGPSRPEEADLPPTLGALADRPGARNDVDWDPAAWRDAAVGADLP